MVVEDLKAWRAGERAGTPDPAVFVAKLKKILEDYHRAGDHRLAGLRDDAARLLYAQLLEYVAGRLETVQEK